MPSKKVIALIPAAGTGKRMATSTHKAFLSWKGKPILEWTLDAFQKCPVVDEIVIMLHQDDMRKASRLMTKYLKVTACLAGGKERQESVLIGLRHIAMENPKSITLIHDAARPFITTELIKKLIQHVKPGLGAVPGVRESNTLKKVKNGKITTTVDRKDVWEVQTPQCFFTEDILKASEKNTGKNLTDDAQAMELSGERVVMVESTPFNFKITYPADLELFKLMAGRKR